MIAEAGGAPGRAAQIAVGWCLKNRMVRNGTSDVERVWSPAFSHHARATATALHDAAGILNGSIPDPTDGATHFYTPQAMPKAGEPTAGVDVGGGLESVPGVSKEGKPAQNYAPSFAVSFTPKIVDNVAPSVFKFFRQPGNGHVR